MQIASAVAVFNLICTVTMSSQTEGGAPEIRRASIVLRVDLQSRRYCFDRCEQTFPIHAVTDGEITFQDETLEGGSVQRLRRVFRDSGLYVAMARVGGAGTTASGHCDPAPFTGFPT